jgi:hypothetical protein
MEKSNEEQMKALQEKLNILNKEQDAIKSAKNSVLKDLEKNYSEVEKTMTKLHENKQEIKEVERQINQLKLNKLKENLNFDNIKKTVVSSSIFQKIKSLPEKINSQTLDEQYQKYKALCVQKGEEIKSKEEFVKLMQDIKSKNFNSIFQKAKSEIQSLSKNAQEIFTEIIKDYEASIDSKDVSKEQQETKQVNTSEKVVKPTKVKKTTVKKQSVQEKPEKSVPAAKQKSKKVSQKSSSLPQAATKTEALQEWIQVQKIKPSILKQDRKTVYEMYKAYITNKYSKSDLLFTYTSGVFSKNLDAAFAKPNVSKKM